MTTFFTSDLHFLHEKIAEYCPGRQVLGDTPRDIAERLIYNWNQVVKYDDIVYIVGDLCMGPIEESLAIIPRLMGDKHLIPGNHDRCWAFAKPRGGFNSPGWKLEYEKVGLTVESSQIQMTVGGPELADAHVVEVCHFPYRGDSHGADRFLYARPFDHGNFLLCGHVHDSWLSMDRMINVGTDVWDYHPVPEHEIVHLIEEIERGI